MKFVKYAKDTWIEDEEAAYSPNGRQNRRGQAIFPDGKLRAFRAGIPDTYFTIPAHARIAGKYVRGFLTIDMNDVIHFNYFNGEGL